MNLNESQEIAKNHLKGPMLVIAGPGSGKTTVITHRIKNLIQKGINPEKILVITFSKAAAINMEQRYRKIAKDNVNFFTFHSLFFKILKKHMNININSILKDDEKTDILKNITHSIDPEMEVDTELVENIASEISLIQNDMINIEYYNSTCTTNNDFKAIYKLYKSYKKENNKIDFDDMLTKSYELLKNNNGILKLWQQKYDYIMIDEFQDINKIQYENIVLLSGKNKNLYIVGDDDQSIYAFRGSRPNFLLNFGDDFKNTKKVVLDTNYRSSDEIIKISNAVIKYNKLRYNKVIKGTKKEGPKPKLIKCESANEEATYIAEKIKKLEIPLNEICIIYRTNIQARAICDAFSMTNIPYILKDATPSIYEHFSVLDILAYLYISLDITRNQELKRIINKPKRYISKGTIELYRNDEILMKSLLSAKHLEHWQKRPLNDLIDHLAIIKDLKPSKAIKYIRKTVGYDDYVKELTKYKKTTSKGIFEILEELGESAKNFDKIEQYLKHIENIKEIEKEKSEAKRVTKKDDMVGVQLSTMHGAKGLEYEAVFVISCVEGIIPHEKSKTDEEIEEERRLFYVALTRAKSLLYISIVNTKYEEPVNPTRFLKGIVYE
ncbi:MAG: ATP-dependent helicase [Defluviitaleaceae bacterium]|nr:ATP-dependent helicase [Defluviitaleaceae bacterium]